MRYIDTGSRKPSDSLGAWLQESLTPEVVGVRFQSGFFSADALGLLSPTLERLAGSNQIVRALIGSNDGGTLRDDVLKLVGLLGIPRTGASLGIVSYSGGAFFHPKTYHLLRSDGSQAAYVGSANFSAAGVASLHVEAGLLVDTRDGDPAEVADQIAEAIDTWFDSTRAGFSAITGPEDVAALTAAGVLAASPPARMPVRGSGGSGAGVETRPRLRPLISLPRLAASVDTGEPGTTPAVAPSIPAPVAAVPRAGFPPYLLFDPGAGHPTSGTAALAGTTLPGGAAGLVVRLNRDSARHFTGGKGTSNFSVPVATASTLRFGIYHGKYERPRAEYGLRLRYLGEGNTLRIAPVETNVMAYGFAPGESGHGDLRMVIPAAVRRLADAIRAAGLPVPRDGDVALVEWPEPTSPEFRMSFLQRGTPLYEIAESAFQTASRTGQLVGEGACWLPAGIAPTW